MPLDVIYGPKIEKKSILEKMAPFVDKLVNLYNQKKMQEWDNQWMTMALKDIEKASDQETMDALFAKAEPDKEWLDIEGATNFAQGALGMLNFTSQSAADLTKQNLPALSAITEGTPKTGLDIKAKPEETAKQPETQMMPDKMEWNELYKFVSELPTGRVDWSNTLQKFQQRLESKKKMGDAATHFLNTILGQGIPDQRAKFESDVKLTDYLMKTLYPETETRLPSSEMELWLTNREVWQQYQHDKAAGKPTLDLEALSQWLVDNNMEITGGTVNPMTDSVSYNFRSKDEKEPFEQVLARAEEYVRRNPNMQISSINFETKSVSVGPRPKETAAAAPKSKVNDILFGDTGIIPKFIKTNTIDMGDPLSEEEKELVIQNYKIRKPVLTAEEIAEIERYFKQIGVDPYAVKLPKDEGNGGEGETGVQWWNPFTWGKLEEENLGKGRDRYGYVKGETREVDGKKYEYVGDNKWKPIS